jgi:sugar lactone lactonase YvrE
MRKFFVPVFVITSLLLGCSKSKTSNVTPTQTASVTTYVGNGTAGLVNAPGTGAELNLPVDITVDQSGNLYVTEQGNNDIRKVAPGGSVSTFAGNGTSGYVDGAGATVAEFNVPEGIVIDDVGNVYVADSQNNVIRKITPAGLVSTYAGNGTKGYVDGPAASAEFNQPNGLAIDKSRNIYVTDFFNNVIRKISSDGTVSTFAGNGSPGLTNGPSGTAEFHLPSGITIDGSNNLFVAESVNSDIREITPSGDVSTFATGLNGPVRITVDGSDNLYVTTSANIIQKVTSTGTVSTYAGNGTPGYNDGSLLQSEFNSPIGLISNFQGVVIVADYGNDRIRVVTP